jgi:acyl-CoA synthetase (NDP forming)
MFGLGGVFVEVFRDVAFRLAPLTREQALAQIDSIRGRALLDGARGRPPVDKGAIADALVALSRFAAAHAEEVASVEVNPFVALPDGGLGLDAVILRG